MLSSFGRISSSRTFLSKSSGGNSSTEMVMASSGQPQVFNRTSRICSTTRFFVFGIGFDSDVRHFFLDSTVILIVRMNVKGTEKPFGNAGGIGIVTAFTRVEGAHGLHFFIRKGKSKMSMLLFMRAGLVVFGKMMAPSWYSKRRMTWPASLP